MIEIRLEGDKVCTREVDQMPEPELQVPDIRADPVRGKKHLRRLMEEEDLRAAEGEQPIVNAINMFYWSVACVMIGMLMAMMK